WNSPRTSSSRPRALSTRLCSGLRSCGPTCLAITRESTLATYRLISYSRSFKVSELRRLHAHVVLLIRLTVSQNRPRRSCHLVGQGHRRHIGRSSCLNLCLPCRRYLSVVHHRSRTMDQQRAQVRVASLGDRSQADPAAGTALPWHQS